MAQVVQTDHLKTDARAALKWSTERRIRQIYTDSFVMYPAAVNVLKTLESIISRPRSTRPEGVLLVAPSGNGKTSLLNHFLQKHPRTSRPQAEKCNVLSMDAPAISSARSMASAVLRSLGALDWERGDLDAKLAILDKLIPPCCVRMMMVDELNNILRGGIQRQESLKILRHLSNRFGISLVLAGIESAQTVVQEDVQLASRLQLVILPKWKDGPAFRSLLRALESTLPLREPSLLAMDEKAKIIVEGSSGILTNIVMITKDAAAAALQDGSERISLDLLRAATKKNQWRRQESQASW